MTYYIDAFLGNQHLFATEDYESYDKLVSVYSVRQRHFPVAAGIPLRITVRMENRINVPAEGFASAVNKGKGKSFIMSLKSRYRKANQVAWQFFELLVKKVLLILQIGLLFI